MAEITTLHPPISKVEVRRGSNPGDDLVNTAGVIAIAKMGETPQARRIYRLYLAEYRKLYGLGLSQKQRETDALCKAIERAGFRINSIDEGGPDNV